MATKRNVPRDLLGNTLTKTTARRYMWTSRRASRTAHVLADEGKFEEAAWFMEESATWAIYARAVLQRLAELDRRKP